MEEARSGLECSLWLLAKTREMSKTLPAFIGPARDTERLPLWQCHPMLHRINRRRPIVSQAVFDARWFS